MNTTTKFLMASLAALGVVACDVDQTKEAEAPDVDVNVSGGNLPAYDVDAPTVNVGTENRTVEVPTVDVDAPADDNKE